MHASPGIRRCKCRTPADGFRPRACLRREMPVVLSTLFQVGALLLLLWLTANALLIVVYRRELWRLWREPVFRHPILIIESDDWGAGPLSQAKALRDIADVLARHRDTTGRAPVFNLALVLAVPDGPAIEADGSLPPHLPRRPDVRPDPVCLAGGAGARGFRVAVAWPGALLASRPDGQRRCADHDWLRQAVPATTEHLPALCRAAGSTQQACRRSRIRKARSARRWTKRSEPSRESSAPAPRSWCRPLSSGPAKWSRPGQRRGSSSSSRPAGATPAATPRACRTVTKVPSPMATGLAASPTWCARTISNPREAVTPRMPCRSWNEPVRGTALSAGKPSRQFHRRPAACAAQPG